MQRAIGIGGLFFRARDPEALNRWYERHLGIAATAESTDVWRQEGGPTVWAVFSADTDYFGRADQAFMVNFRVADLEAMLAQLRTAGATVEDRIDEGEQGRFGWATDPEGNRFELWQPA